MAQHVRRFLDGTPLSINGLNADDPPPSTATEIFIGPTGVASEFVRMTADATVDVAPDFGYDPTQEVLLSNGLTVRYGNPFGDANNGIGFSLTAGESPSTVSSYVPQSVSAADLLAWLADFSWFFDGEDLNVKPPEQAKAVKAAVPLRSQVHQMVPDAGLLTMELAGPALTSPKGTGMRVPGGLLYRRTVKGQIAHLILDGGDVMTKMLPFPDMIKDPAALIAEASQLVVHRA